MLGQTESATPPIIGADQLRPLFDQVKGFLSHWREPTPRFTFRLGWCGNYEELLREEFAETSGTDEILKRAIKTGRALVSGRGGAAKTTIVYRIARELLNSGEALPVIVNLKMWRAPFYEDWNKLPEDFAYKLDMLLGHLAIPKLNLAVLDGITPQILKVLIVDGLNELTPLVAQQIISAIDEYIRRAGQSIAIVTDRIVRRSFASTGKWQLCSLIPLDDDEIRRQLASHSVKLQAFETSSPTQRQLLRTPLFLDQFLKSSQTTGLLTTAAEFQYYFCQQIGLSVDELLKAANAAFDMYQDQHARTFQLQAFQTVAGTELTSKLTSAGTIVSTQNSAYFYHHLHHDYLASIVLASDANKWTHEGFDTISFKAASFDSIALALQQLTDGERADAFTRALYDWNVYAPAYALSEAHHGGFLKASREMQVIIYAMLAEKKWDIILRTAERATDALATFPAESEARAFLDLPSLSALLDHVNGLSLQGKRFAEWRSIFGLRYNQVVPDDFLDQIRSSDSIIGWTLANVLKRTEMSSQRQRQLRSWGRDRNQDASVLWRVVHVLGAYPTQDNFKFLLEILDNKQKFWPRYGALRSLLEIAARSTDKNLPFQVFKSLKERVSQLDSPDILAELERALFVRNPPPVWLDAAIVLLDGLYSSKSDETDRKRWLRVGQLLTKEYRQKATSIC